ncbi:MAG TPA: sulfite reductase subunit alpha [Burkholderiales bacterium]|nr:sulfite reductase subunit alpha [Burkholderiales bacterium]
MSEVPVIPETAPFTTAQRAWLNGFFAGLLSAEALAAGPGAVPAPEPEEAFPWHDPTLGLEERIKLAEGRPPARRMMAAMGQLDCGQCGYLCKTYAEAITSGVEKDLGKCVPGGKPTAKMLKVLVGEAPPPAPPRAPAPAAVPAVAPASMPVTRDQPARARLLRSEPLNRPGAEKQTQNVVLSLAGTGLDYAPGDSLGVWPVNNGEEVELVLAILRAKGSEAVTLPSGQTLTVREALLRRCNLREPSDELFMLLSRHARDDIEATRLARMAEGEDAAGHDVFDLLVKFRSARPPAPEFVLALAALQPRLYSIASSLACHPGEVHLTVAVVRYELHARGYQGVASCFFADRLRRGARVPVYVQPAHGFCLPADPAAPIIMVGPGTGIAPFRAFLQERAATGAPGKNWLFFGNQRRELDFLYRGEFEGYARKGLLTRLDAAFSRDQAHKIYVQDRMREHGAELWRWLENGACFYVCGDAQRMAKDVDDALKALVGERGGMSAGQAAEYVAGLAKAGRYCKDVY